MIVNTLRSVCGADTIEPFELTYDSVLTSDHILHEIFQCMLDSKIKLFDSFTIQDNLDLPFRKKVIRKRRKAQKP